MSASRRVVESVNRPYAAAALDAAVERQARRGAGASLASPDRPTSFAEPYREAHLESFRPRTAPSTVRAAALERLGAHLAADENFGRKLSKDAARALNGVNYLTEREKRILAGLDKRAWGALVEASDKFKVAVGKKSLAGLPSGSSQFGDYFNGFKFGGAGSAPADWGAGRTPPGGAAGGFAAGFKVPGQTAGGRGAGSGSQGGDVGGGRRGSGSLGDLGGFSTPQRSGTSLVSGFSNRGIDVGHLGGGLAPPVNRPAPNNGYDRAVSDGVVAVEATAWEHHVYDRERLDELRLKEGPSVGDKEQWKLEQRLLEAADDVLSFDGYDFDMEQDRIENGPEVPPNPYGDEPSPPPDESNPNPEDPRGPRPGGPQSQVTSRGTYLSAGRVAIPNDEGTGGPGPIGPWSRATSKGAYLPWGRIARPNDEGTGGTGPVGPSS